MTRPEVDVVVTLYRPGAWIEGCLASVRAQSDVRVRTILVDDNPAVPLARKLATTMPDAIGLECTQRRGFAAANNAGIARGDAPIVVCLNQDARLAENYLGRLLSRFTAMPELASASGKLLHQPSPESQPDGLIDSAGILMLPGRRTVDEGQGELDDGRFDGWREVFGVSAAAGAYRRSALEAVSNGSTVFDETFFMYKEDVDLAWRLRRAGFTAGVDGAAIAYHGRSVGRSLPRSGLLGPMVMLWMQERAKPTRVRRLSWRNQMLLILKNESAASLASALPALIAMQIAHACVDLFLDPVGGLLNRWKLMVRLPEALRSRTGLGSVDLSRWLR